MEMLLYDIPFERLHISCLGWSISWKCHLLFWLSAELPTIIHMFYHQLLMPTPSPQCRAQKNPEASGRTPNSQCLICTTKLGRKRQARTRETLRTSSSRVYRRVVPNAQGKVKQKWNKTLPAQWCRSWYFLNVLGNAKWEQIKTSASHAQNWR
jgi:hypothetical protein